VGTTTTAIHLAAVAARAGCRVLLIDADPVGCIGSALDAGQRGQRHELRALGLDRPGGFWSDVIPGLDVLSPFDEGLGADDDQEALLGALAAGRRSYQCVIVDSAPFMGERPRHLLRQCDELLLVMRAEPVAFRTLPLFFETVKAIEREDGGVSLRGILLTQPAPGKWETDLRRYLGSRACAQTIPHDPEADQVLALTTATSTSPAALQYQELCAALELTTAELAVAGNARTKPAPLVAASASGRRSASSRNGTDGSLRRGRPQAPVAVSGAAARPATRPTPRARRRKAPRRHTSSLRPWHMWIGAGMLSGTFLGSVRSPEYVVPAAVGLATTAGVVLVMQLLGSSEPRQSLRRPAAGSPRDRSAGG
jgi:cellulose biosynthesis protein BcsQ